MGFLDALTRHSPGYDIYNEPDFVAKTYRALAAHGFNADNTIACAGLCRDEITQPMAAIIREAWGESFNLSSLAGMFFAGRTGLSAAMHHSPNTSGRERYVFYSMPHIAVNDDGEIGACRRKGRDGISIACGALGAFRKEMESGRLDMRLDGEDVEQSLLKMRLIKEIAYGSVPDLLELTVLTQKAALSDIERAIGYVVDEIKSDYAVITGIQVHGPDGNYVWRATCYAVIAGERADIRLEAPSVEEMSLGRLA